MLACGGWKGAMAVPSLTTQLLVMRQLSLLKAVVTYSHQLVSVVLWPGGWVRLTVRPQFRRNTMKVPARFSASSMAQRGPSRGWLSLIWVLSLLVVGLCSAPAPAHAQNAIVLVGSGSTVPAPLYNRWTQEYKRNPNLQMRYLPVGTSEGIKQISHGAGDFAAGEAQLTEKERKEGDLIELPVVLIGIVPI